MERDLGEHYKCAIKTININNFTPEITRISFKRLFKMKFNIFLFVAAIFLVFVQISSAAPWWPKSSATTPKPPPSKPGKPSQAREDAMRDLIYQAIN